MESWAEKVECEVVELWKQLEQLNVKVKNLEDENELASQQKASSSHSSKLEQLQ
jgi:hypothetical protein